MKKYVLFFVMIVLVAHSLKAMKLPNLRQPGIPIFSLKYLCRRKILAQPREYIKRNGGDKLPKEVQQYIANRGYTVWIQVHFCVKEIEDLDTNSPDFLSRLLLVKECHKTLKRLAKTKQFETITLTEQEKKVFNNMPRVIRQMMEAYITK